MPKPSMMFSGLPPSCPPEPRDSSALSGVYRVLQGAAPVDWDWLSLRDRGVPLPFGGDSCKYAGLSLFRNPKAARKLQNLKHLTHAARMEFPEGTGAHTGGSKGNHVTIWIADGKSCADCVAEVVEIEL